MPRVPRPVQQIVFNGNVSIEGSIGINEKTRRGAGINEETHRGTGNNEECLYGTDSDEETFRGTDINESDEATFRGTGINRYDEETQPFPDSPRQPQESTGSPRHIPTIPASLPDNHSKSKQHSGAIEGSLKKQKNIT